MFDNIDVLFSQKMFAVISLTAHAVIAISKTKKSKVTFHQILLIGILEW